MKKTIWMLLAALLLLPAASSAEGLAGFEEAVGGALETAAQIEKPDFIGPVRRAPLMEDVIAQDLTDDTADAEAMAQAAELTDEPVADEVEVIEAEPEAESEDVAQEDALPEEIAPAAATETAPAPSADLTLAINAQADRLEEGQSLVLTVIAGNPIAQDMPVTLTMSLPERLSCMQETAWEAVLPAAEVDEHGNVIPSETAFIREVTLSEGGEDEVITLEAELNMGARFYRASTELTLCVPDVQVTAETDGVQNGRVQPGDAYSYRIDVSNSGTASRDVAIEMILPEGVTLAGELPEGFIQSGRTLSGAVRAEAAAQVGDTSAASHAQIDIPVRVDEDALAGDADATKLLSGVLRADGERIAMPRVQACAAQITARLIPEADSLEVGGQMDLRIVVANTGLAPADVRVSCLLPEGLSLAKSEERATPGEPAAALPPEDGARPQAAAMLTEEAELPVIEFVPENSTLIYDLHMDAAKETAQGVIANTQELTVRVQADQAQQGLREKLVGAALSYQTDEGTQLAEAVAVRVYTPSFMGITKSEWGGIFWAAVLLIVTVSCLYAAIKSDGDETDYCFD